MTAARSCLERPSRKHFADKFGIPGAGQRDRLRKACASQSHVTVQDFVMKYRRDSQPRIFEQPLLHGVSEDRSLAWAHVFTLSGDLPDPVLQNVARFLSRELSAAGCEIRLRLCLRPR